MARSTRDPFAPRLPAAYHASLEVELEEGAEWSGLEVTADFSSQAATHLDVSQCRMRNATFTSTELGRWRLTDSTFVGCEMSGARVHEGSLTRVEFRDCRMLGFSAAQGQLEDVYFVDCRLDDAEFRMTRGDRIHFDSCSLVGADFYAARLAHLQLSDCDLTNVEFSQAELPGARFHGSRLDQLRGARSLRDITIDSMQIIPMAMAMFSATGVRVDDDRSSPDA